MGRASRRKAERHARVRPQVHLGRAGPDLEKLVEAATAVATAKARTQRPEVVEPLAAQAALLMMQAPGLFTRDQPPDERQVQEAFDAAGWTMDEVQASALVLAALASWGLYRQVFEFDTQTLLALLETPLPDDVPLSQLARLPYPAFYLNFPGPSVHGAYVVLFDGEDSHPELMLYADPGWPDRTPAAGELPLPTLLPVNLPLAGTFGQGRRWRTESMTQAKRALDPQEQLEDSGQALLDVESALDKFASYADWLLVRIVPLLLYLTVDDPDLVRDTGSHRAHGASGHGASPPDQEPVDLWRVGTRVGAALRHAHGLGRPAARGAGSARARPRPHLRRGHYHRFWVGAHDSPDRHLELHWLPPTPVNVDAEHPSVTTIRPVQAPS